MRCKSGWLHAPDEILDNEYLWTAKCRLNRDNYLSRQHKHQNLLQRDIAQGGYIAGKITGPIRLNLRKRAGWVTPGYHALISTKSPGWPRGQHCHCLIAPFRMGAGEVHILGWVGCESGGRPAVHGWERLPGYRMFLWIFSYIRTLTLKKLVRLLNYLF